MKILYGIQTTGNGHLVRSRNIIGKLKQFGHEVFTVFSGDINKRIWDVQFFEPYTCKQGLTFCTKGGKLSYLRTIKQLNFIQFYWDILSWKQDQYDLVITDYEPITARIARNKGIPSMGVGHLYSFCYNIPNSKRTMSPIRLLVNSFAPVDIPLGLHWHHFGQPILPPTIPDDVQKISHRESIDEKKILVYLPFEDQQYVKTLLSHFQDYIFHIYSPLDSEEYRQRNLVVHPLSREGFIRDLSDCCGVICNTGFSLTSEAIHLGKKILTRPLSKQMEQESNAVALEQLGWGTVIHGLDEEHIRNWLDRPSQQPKHYPDVGSELVRWINEGKWDNVRELSKGIWSKINNN